MTDRPEQLDLAPELGLDSARDLGELSTLEADLDAVEAALQRLDDGTYGSCARCGAPLAGLDEDPLKRFCPEHPAPEQPA